MVFARKRDPWAGLKALGMGALEAASFGLADDAIGLFDAQAGQAWRDGADELREQEAGLFALGGVGGTLAPVGGLFGAGRALMRGMKKPPARPTVVYHGSPHKFDQFSSSKIGTGEGATAYGHGLYFAESRDVAEAYKKALAKDGGGHVYAVQVRAQPDEFIDLDAPFGKQPAKVRRALAKVYGEPERRIPRSATAKVVGEDEARRVAQEGIVGARYLDAGSRQAGGSRNMVVFDDSRLTTLSRDEDALNPLVAPPLTPRARGVDPNMLAGVAVGAPIGVGAGLVGEAAIRDPAGLQEAARQGVETVRTPLDFLSMAGLQATRDAAGGAARWLPVDQFTRDGFLQTAADARDGQDAIVEDRLRRAGVPEHEIARLKADGTLRNDPRLRSATFAADGRFSPMAARLARHTEKLEAR